MFRMTANLCSVCTVAQPIQGFEDCAGKLQGETAIVFRFDYSIKFARIILETRAVQNDHRAAVVIYQAGLPQSVGGDGFLELKMLSGLLA